MAYNKSLGVDSNLYKQSLQWMVRSPVWGSWHDTKLHEQWQTPHHFLCTCNASKRGCVHDIMSYRVSLVRLSSGRFKSFSSCGLIWTTTTPNKVLSLFVKQFSYWLLYQRVSHFERKLIYHEAMMPLIWEKKIGQVEAVEIKQFRWSTFSAGHLLPSFKLHRTEGFCKLLLLWRQWSNGIFELLQCMASLVGKKYEDIKSHSSQCLMPLRLQESSDISSQLGDY